MLCACAVLSSVACTALQYFSTLSHKWHDFRKKSTENKMCVLISSATFIRNISHSKKNLARYDQKCILVFTLKYPLFFNELWNFSTVFQKVLKCQISWKSVQWEPGCSMRTEGRTDRHGEDNSRFSQLCERA